MKFIDPHDALTAPDEKGRCEEQLTDVARLRRRQVLRMTSAAGFGLLGYRRHAAQQTSPAFLFARWLIKRPPLNRPVPK